MTNLQVTDISKLYEYWQQTHTRQVNGPPEAGVLVPFFNRNNQLHLLLTERSSNLRKHSGQISFPGGKADEEDRNIIEPALRETQEEVGLEREDIDIVGKFNDFRTPHYRAVTPVLAIVKSSNYYINSPEEIESIIEVPVKDLLDPSIHHQEYREYQKRRYPLHFFEWESKKRDQIYVIWGATGGVIYELIELIRKFRSKDIL